MSVILAIDPGLRGCGVAVFTDGQLTFGGYAVNPVKKDRGPEAWSAMAKAVSEMVPLAVNVVVLEVPQVYRGPYGGDPADLIELAGVDGSIVGQFMQRADEFVGYLPREWKGQCPKPVHHARVMAELSDDEKATVEIPPQKALAHNVWDGVALGLFYVQSQKLRAALVRTSV